MLMDARSSAEIAKQLLPAGYVTGNYEGQDSYRPDQLGVAARGSMSVDDGAGKLTTVTASVSQNDFSDHKVTDCATLQAVDPAVGGCQAIPESDGSTVLVYREDQYRPDAVAGPTKGSYANVAVRLFKDGSRVEIDATNYFDPLDDPHNKGWHVDPSRTDALLSLDQLKTMVMDPRWSLTVATEFGHQAKQDLKPYVDNTQKN